MILFLLLTALIWPTAAQLRTLNGHAQAIRAVAINSGGDNLFTGSDDFNIRQWSIDSGAAIQIFYGHSNPVLSVAISGDFLFSGSADLTVRQWSTINGGFIRTFTGHTSAVWAVAVSGDNLLSGSADRVIRQWSISTGVLIRNFTAHLAAVYSLAASGNNLFSGSADYTVKQWSVSTGGLIRNYTGHSNMVSSLALSGDFLFSGSWDNTIRRWSIINGSLIRIFTGHILPVLSVAISGDLLYSGSRDNTTRQWSISTGATIRNYFGHTDSVSSVAVRGDFLFSGSMDKTIKQWCAGNTRQAAGQCLESSSIATCIRNFTDLGSAVTGLTAYGDNLFYGGNGGIRQYSLDSLTSVRNISLTPSYMLLNNDNLYVGTGVGVSVYSATSGSVIRTINAGGSVNALAINSVHMFLAIGNNIVQYALTGGALVAVFSAHTGAVNTVAATDSWLFSGSVDASLRKWNITTVTSLAPVNQLAAVNALAIQGDSVFVGSDVVRHYSVSSNSLLATWSTGNAVVWSLAVSGDYAFAGMGSPDFSILQWKISNNTLLYSYTGHTANVLEITIGGGFMFSGAASTDNSVKMWHVDGLEMFVSLTIGSNDNNIQPITVGAVPTMVSTWPQIEYHTVAVETPVETRLMTLSALFTALTTPIVQQTVQPTMISSRTVPATISQRPTQTLVMAMSTDTFCRPLISNALLAANDTDRLKLGDSVSLFESQEAATENQSQSIRIRVPSEGGMWARISGGNFATKLPPQCLRFDSAIGDTFGNCTTISVDLAASVINCKLPAGVGTDVSFTIWLTSDVQGTRTALPSISYQPPWITNVQSLDYFIVQDNLTIYGNNFGIWPASVDVRLLGRGNGTNIQIPLSTCKLVSHRILSGCQIPNRLQQPSGQYYIVLTVAGQQVHTGGDNSHNSTNSTSSNSTSSNSSGDFIITLHNNRLPVAAGFRVNVAWNESQGFNINLQGSDADEGQQLTYRILSLPAAGELYEPSATGSRIIQSVPFTLNDGGATTATHVVNYRPDRLNDGLFTFTYQVVDPLQGASETAQIQIYVYLITAAPEITVPISTFDMTENTQPVVITFPVNDDTEKQWLAIRVTPDHQYMKGKWIYNTSSDAEINFNSPASLQPLIFEYSYRQKVQPKLLVVHDNRRSSNPYARFSYTVQNSMASEALTTGTVQVVVKCPAGLFNNIWSDGNSVCLDCPFGAQCSQAGDYYPINKAGFYPVELFIYMPCSPTDACPATSNPVSPANVSLEAYTALFSGKSTNGTDNYFQCAEGYTSIRCGQCAKMFYRKGDRCAACPTYNLTPAVIAILVIVGVLIILVAVNFLRKIDIGFIGILLSYWQMVSILQTFKLNWPPIVTSTLHYLSFIYFNIEITSPECYVTDDNSRTYELKWYATEAQPLIVIIVIAILMFFNFLWLQIRKFFKGVKGSADKQLPTKRPSIAVKIEIEKSAVISAEKPSKIRKTSSTNRISLMLPTDILQREIPSVQRGLVAKIAAQQHQHDDGGNLSPEEQARNLFKPELVPPGSPQNDQISINDLQGAVLKSPPLSVRRSSVLTPLEDREKLTIDNNRPRRSVQLSLPPSPTAAAAATTTVVKSHSSILVPQDDERPQLAANTKSLQMAIMHEYARADDDAAAALSQSENDLQKDAALAYKSKPPRQRRKTNVWDIVTASYNDLLDDDDDCGGGGETTFAATLFGIFTLILKLIYINVSLKSLELFDCSYNPTNSKFYFEAEPNRVCYADWWMAILPFAVGAIVLYVIGIPLLFLGMFVLRRRYLKIPGYRRSNWQKFILQATFKRRSEFRPETEYWDVILLFRKLCIVFCQLMFNAYTAFQAQVLVIILLLFLVGHVYISPYSMRSLNFLEGVSMLSSIVVLSCGLMFYVSQFQAQASADIMAYAVLAIVAISSLLVLGMLVYHVRTMYLQHQRQKKLQKSK